MMKRMLVLTLGSAALSAAVVSNAYYRKQQFYPTVVYLLNSSRSMGVRTDKEVLQLDTQQIRYTCTRHTGSMPACMNECSPVIAMGCKGQSVCLLVYECLFYALTCLLPVWSLLVWSQ